MSTTSSGWQDTILDAQTDIAATEEALAALRVPGLTILSHPYPQRVGERAALVSLAAGEEVEVSRLTPIFSGTGGGKKRPLSDPHLSRHPVLLQPASGGVQLDPNGSATRLVANGQRVTTPREVTLGELEAGVVLLLGDWVAVLLHLLSPPQADAPSYGLIGESPSMLTMRQEIQRVADLDVAVLLRGETGTGKELVANALHSASKRRDKPFVAVNMAAIPASVAAAELFGAEKGAFTGAERSRGGFFRRANGGTLFLDEVGETPEEVQAMLLRVLENGEAQPVGAEHPVPVDVRLVAATDSDLEAAIAAGAFRAPLLHRLATYEIRLPPLRHRRDDIGRLLYAFLEQELEEVGEAERLRSPDPTRPWITAPLVARLASYEWPGNVRQLRNVARQLVIYNRGADRAQIGPQIETLLEPPPVQDPTVAPAPAVPTPPPKPQYRPPTEVSEEELLKTLHEHRFRLKPTAEALRVSRTSLYSLIERSARVRKARDLGRGELMRAWQSSGGDLEAMVDALEVSKEGIQRRMHELGLP